MALRDEVLTLTALELHRILRAWGTEQADAAGLTTPERRAFLYGKNDPDLALVLTMADRDVATRSSLTSISDAKRFVQRVVDGEEGIYTPQSEG